MRRRKTKRGVALVTVLIISLIVAGIATSALTYSTSMINAKFKMDSVTAGLYACEGAFEQVRYSCLTSAYDFTGNIWLYTNSSPNGKVAIPSLMVGRWNVSVTMFDLTNGYYRAIARAVYGSTEVSAAMEIRGRDSFSKYLFFSDAASLNLGTSVFGGAVHSNLSLNYYYGGAKLYGEATAAGGFTFNSGASWANTTFYAGYNQSASKIAMPTTTSITSLSTQALPEYKLTGYPQGSKTEIVFSGTNVQLTVKSGTGVVLSDTTLPLPPNGLIYTDLPISSIRGDMAGRVSVATPSTVSITGKIRYVDSSGNPANQIIDLATGNPVADTPTGASWAGPNYEYRANPSYAPDPDAPPVVGIIAGGNIVIDKTAPYNMEMMAAVYSATGKWYADTTLKKGNLRTLMSDVTKNGGYTYTNTGYGYAVSRNYQYDTNLLTFPPPFYLGLDKPIFGAKRML